MEEQFTPAMLTAYHWQVFTHIPHPPPLLLLLLLSLEMAICNMHLKFINVHMHALLGGMQLVDGLLVLFNRSILVSRLHMSALS